MSARMLYLDVCVRGYPRQNFWQKPLVRIEIVSRLTLVIVCRSGLRIWQFSYSLLPFLFLYSDIELRRTRTRTPHAGFPQSWKILEKKWSWKVMEKSTCAMPIPRMRMAVRGGGGHYSVTFNFLNSD